jgi:GT2 family glycosyltransferase
MQARDVRIIVLNWRRAQETIQCLESLAAADLQGASLMVVDNGSHDGSTEAIRARFPDVRILPLPVNVGFAGGANAGIRAALDDGVAGVLLLNNDAQVAPDFLPPLLDAMNSSPQAGAVSSAVFRMDRPELLDVAYCEVHLAERHVVQIIGVNALPGEGFDRRLDVPVVIGCSLLISAAALRSVALFDEAYFAYHEDVDWCLRARKAGYQLFYEPLSRVFHRGSRSTGAMVETRPPQSDAGATGPALSNAEPLPWNPVRTYLGIRNTFRLLRTYANRKQRSRFALAIIREVPLEFTALVMDKAGWMRLGRWGYAQFAREYFVDRHRVLRETPRGPLGRVRRAGAFAVLPVVDVLWCLPRDVVRAWRTGRLDEFFEYLRGLRDGVLDRRLPLERLGLR